MRHEFPEPGRPSGRRQAPRRRRRVVACVWYRVGGRGDGVLRGLGRPWAPPCSPPWAPPVDSGVPFSSTNTRGAEKTSPRRAAPRRRPSAPTRRPRRHDDRDALALRGGVRVGVVRVERAAQLEVELVRRRRHGPARVDRQLAPRLGPAARARAPPPAAPRPSRSPRRAGRAPSATRRASHHLTRTRAAPGARPPSPPAAETICVQNQP